MRALYRAACVAGLLATAACSPKKPTPPPVDLTWYLQPAFRAAFGADAPAPHDVERAGKTVTMEYAPHQLTDLGGDRLALISIGTPDGCLDCGGAVAVHYLKKSADGFQVLGQWYDLRPKPTTGALPEAHIRTDLFARPALQLEVPDRNQGCVTASASLFELGPDAPILRAQDIVTARSNVAMGGVRVGVQVDDYANVYAETKDQRFKVTYRGTLPGDMHYAPVAGKPDALWAVVKKDIQLPEC